MHKRLVSSVLSAMAVSASAQPELLIVLREAPGGFHWTATATLQNPETDVLATISDLGFELRGYGIENFNYNPAFDSDFFGPANVSVTSDQVNFLGGNTIPPLNNADGPDSSNPLHLFTVDAMIIDGFELVGQVGGAYVGSPFPRTIVYQTASGETGDVPYAIRIYPCCTPTPGSLAALGIAIPFALRRRR